MIKMLIDKENLNTIFKNYFKNYRMEVSDATYAVNGLKLENARCDISLTTIIELNGKKVSSVVTLDNDTILDAIRTAYPNMEIDSIEENFFYEYWRNDAEISFNGFNVKVKKQNKVLIK